MGEVFITGPTHALWTRRLPRHDDGPSDAYCGRFSRTGIGCNATRGVWGINSVGREHEQAIPRAGKPWKSGGWRGRSLDCWGLPQLEPEG